MTKQEFNALFRGRMLVLLTEAWACRKADASSLGLLMDDHARKIRVLLDEMYEALTPKPTPAQNGQAATRGSNEGSRV